MTPETETNARPPEIALQPLNVAYGLPLPQAVSPFMASLLNGLAPTDAGQAEALALLYGDRLRYDHTSRHWLCWDGVRWKADEDGEPERLTLDTARARLAAAAQCEDAGQRQTLAKWALACEGTYRRAAVLEAAQSLRSLATTAARFDTAPWLLVCTNGVVDLRTGELRPGNPGDMLTKSTGVIYDRGALCGRWLRFLEEVFAGDEDLVAFIKRAVGYSLTGDTSEQCAFICYGTGSNGKGVFLELLRTILGECAVNTAFATFEDPGKRGHSIPNDLAALRGARLVTASEIADGKRLNEARFKSLTGEDPISARFLFSEWFSFKPVAKHWLAVNHKPTIQETTKAIWRRIRLIPFTATFEPDLEPTLLATLKAEASGILNWAIAGCLDWQATRLGTAKSVAEATEKYRLESDLVGSFLGEKTTANPSDGEREAKVAAGALYSAYLDWCKVTGHRPMSGTAFGRQMTERGKQRTTGREYIGLRLLSLQEELTQADASQEAPV